MTPRRWLLILIAMTALLGAAAPARADTTVQVDVGWDGQYRPGRWTPLFVTVQDSTPREVAIETYAPTDRRYAMTVVQGMAIGPTPVTVPIYVPLSYSTDETSVTVRDANSGRRLEMLALADQSPTSSRPALSPVADSTLFIGLSGNMNSARLVSSQLTRSQTVAVGVLPQSRLPAVVTGYDGLDVLMLNGPNLSQLDLDQQSAIVQWVRQGGRLVIWPGSDPIPAAGVLQNILPATIGPVRIFDLPAANVQKLGLPARFAKLSGRTLVNVSDDAKRLSIFGGDQPDGYRRWVGLGQVVLLAGDVSTLLFNDTDHATKFWRLVLAGVTTIPAPDATPSVPYYAPFGMSDDPRRTRARAESMDWIANIPGAGKFGFSYLATILIAMMLIVGPVDWFVLKWLGRQPWTWVTTSGWIALITLCAIYTGHLFKSGDLHFRTVTMIDEAGGARIAASDLVGIYSPQTRAYPMAFDPHTWWRPAGETTPFGNSGLRTDIRVHQDYRGTTPLPMLINLWNIRFLEGTDYNEAPAMLSAKLSVHGGAIEGSVSNQTDMPITLDVLRTSAGILKVQAKIGPGGTLPISGKLKVDKSYATTRPDPQEAWRIYYNRNADAPATQPSVAHAVDLGSERSDQIEKALAEQDDLACLYAKYEAPPPRVTLDDESAKREHVGYIRSLVRMEK